MTVAQHEARGAARKLTAQCTGTAYKLFLYCTVFVMGAGGDNNENIEIGKRCVEIR
jgi:hypothetical protein